MSIKNTAEASVNTIDFIPQRSRHSTLLSLLSRSSSRCKRHQKLFFNNRKSPSCKYRDAIGIGIQNRFKVKTPNSISSSFLDNSIPLTNTPKFSNLRIKYVKITPSRLKLLDNIFHNKS